MSDHGIGRLGVYQKAVAGRLGGVPMPTGEALAVMRAHGANYSEGTARSSMESLARRGVAAEAPGGWVRGPAWPAAARRYGWDAAAPGGHGALWAALEAALRDGAAAAGVASGDEVVIEIPPPGVPGVSWSVHAADGRGGLVALGGGRAAAFEAARSAAEALAQEMPLLLDPAAEVAETILVRSREADGMSVAVVNVLGSGEWVFPVRGPADLAKFEAARAPVLEDTPWDEARRRRVVRMDSVSGLPVAVEPGAAYFVEAVERLGGRTLLTCEGHPDGFHVVFAAPYPTALAVAAATGLVVEVFLAGPWRRPEQWRLRLDGAVPSYRQRDARLRKAARLLDRLAALVERARQSGDTRSVHDIWSGAAAAPDA